MTVTCVVDGKTTGILFMKKEEPCIAMYSSKAAGRMCWRKEDVVREEEAWQKSMA